MNKIDAFWNWFSEHENYIYNNLRKQPEDVSYMIHEELMKVHPDLVFDIPFEKVGDAYEFIISADGDEFLFPTVFDLCDQAPSIHRWMIIPLRPRTNQLDQAIDLDGLYLEYEDIFYSSPNEELPMELEIYIRGYEEGDNRYVHGYFLLLDTLLGEYDAVTQTQTIKVEPLEDEEEVQRFLELRDEFDKRVQKKNNS